jgi:putative addiction module antidote
MGGGRRARPQKIGLGCYNFCGYAAPVVLELKLRKIGKSLGLVLPKEALARLNVGEGDTVTLTDAPEGGLHVTPATKGREQFAKQMHAAEGIIRRFPNTLHELAG